MSKQYDIAVKVGEYTDREGNTKGRYMNVGAVIQGDKGPYIVLDRTFNPAGVPNPDGRSSVLLSLFAPKDADQRPQAKPASQPAGGDGFDDDIGF
jgi:hypothetical protein